jgi:hypothetical protein
MLTLRILPIGKPLTDPPGILGAGFFVDAANKAFSSKLKANAAPVDATAVFFKKLRRFRFPDIIHLSFHALSYLALDFTQGFCLAPRPVLGVFAAIYCGVV